MNLPPDGSDRSPRPAPFRAADVHLRPATHDDALCLSMLALQVFLDTYAIEGIRPAIAREVATTYSERSFQHAIGEPATRLSVAERAGHLIGFAQVTLGATHALAPAGIQAELLRLYVQERFTGLGIGTRLLREAENLARGADAAVMWLTPWSYNHRALAFYACRGYQDFGLTYFTFEGESHENRVCAKRL